MVFKDGMPIFLCHGSQEVQPEGNNDAAATLGGRRLRAAGGTLK